MRLIDGTLDALFETRASRKAIGFAPRLAWREAPAVFDTHTLSIQGHPVMEDWEETYMATLAQIAAGGGGAVLEVGFGMGISARHIHTYPIDRHVVIEANRDVFSRLKDFARHKRNVTPLLGFWEDVTPMLPDSSFDGILFDTYPLSEAEIHENHFPFFREAYRLLKHDGVLTYYSDETEAFSPRHLAALTDAGFTRITGTPCAVAPPPDCAYWKAPTLLAPQVRK